MTTSDTSSSNDQKVEIEKGTFRKLYAAISLMSFSNGVYAPFIGIYAAEIGFGYSEMGTLRAVGNVTPTLLQPVWGGLSDRYANRKLFIVIGLIFASLLLPTFLYIQTPVELILLYGLQSVFLSMTIPTWNALLGGLIPEEKRGTLLSKINTFGSIWSLVATILSGALMTLIVTSSVREVYVIPFYLSAISGILASVVVVFIKEPTIKNKKNKSTGFMLKKIGINKHFKKLLLASIVYSGGMSMIWPYFPIILVNIIHASKIEISLQNALQFLMLILLQPYFGRIIDRVGRKPIIVLSRFLLVPVPFILLFATNMIPIYIIALIAGVSFAMLNNAILAYIFDVSPPEEQASYVAIYNVVTGILFFFGSLVGGFLGDYFSLFVNPYIAMEIVIVVCGVLRLIGSFFYLSLEEPKVYKKTLRAEFMQVIRNVKRSIVHFLDVAKPNLSLK